MSFVIGINNGMQRIEIIVRKQKKENVNIMILKRIYLIDIRIKTSVYKKTEEYNFSLSRIHVERNCT